MTTALLALVLVWVFTWRRRGPDGDRAPSLCDDGAVRGVDP